MVLTGSSGLGSIIHEAETQYPRSSYLGFIHSTYLAVPLRDVTNSGELGYAILPKSSANSATPFPHTEAHVVNQ